MSNGGFVNYYSKLHFRIIKKYTISLYDPQYAIQQQRRVLRQEHAKCFFFPIEKLSRENRHYRVLPTLRYYYYYIYSVPGYSTKAIVLKIL